MAEPTPSATWRTIADAFGARVDGVGPGGWDRPTPCAGWVARDLIVHLAGWVPPLLADGAGVVLTAGPDPAADPAGAWHHLDDQITELLAAPDLDTRIFDHDQAGRHPLGDAVLRFVGGDVFVHTWDLARATGQDETLDADLVRQQVAGLEQMGDALAASGQYAPAVPVATTADAQTQLIALTGRRP